jgi:predicted permease
MLLTIGAKIKVRDLTLKVVPIVISNSLKLIILPVVVYFLASYYDLSQTEIVVAVIFASVPTAAMSYSLAQQFGADYQLMRAILTTQVALSFITIPLLLAFIA